MAAKTGVQFARAAAAFIGTPYVYGGSSPKGFDCSGLVYYVLGKMGISAPRTSEAQYRWATPVSAAQLKPGDLVFLNFPGEQSPGHVMIWLGQNKVLQAPSAGQKVQVSSFNPKAPGSNEWGATVVGYGKIPGLSYKGSAAANTAALDQSLTTGEALQVGTPTGYPGQSVVQGVKGAASDAEAVGSFLGDLSSASFWIRALEIIGGGLVLLLGLYLLAKQAGLGGVGPPAAPGLSEETLEALQDSPGAEHHRPAYRRSTEGVKRGKVVRHELTDAADRKARTKELSKKASPDFGDVPY